MEVYTRVCQCVILLSVIAYSEAQYNEPSDTYPNIQFQSEVEATSRCSGTSGCLLNGCTNPRSSPLPWTLIRWQSSCTVSQNIPGSISGSTIYVNSSISSSCQRNTSVSVSASRGYTLSFWIYLNVSQAVGTTNRVQIFLIGSTAITLGYERQLFINNNHINNVKPLSNGRWHHIVLRYEKNGGANRIIDGVRNIGLPEANNTLPDAVSIINFNPVFLSTADNFYLADFRFYSDYLTQRDINNIRGSSNPSGLTASECRCPPFYGDLDQLDPEGLYCLEPTDNPDSTTPRTLRLKPEGHYAVFAADKNESTTWRSRTLTSDPQESITITLIQKYMIEKIEIYSLSGTAIPNTISVELIRGNGESSIFSSDNGSVNSKYIFNFREDLSLSSTSNRTEVERMVAKDVKITFTGNRGGSTYYEIGEILITGRCYCHGVSTSCNRNATSSTYECRCTSGSDSSGPSCEVCKGGYYRREEEFRCSTTCGCSTTGTIGNTSICEADGGQCKCKQNVDLRDCSQCKPLSYNLTTAGCQTCTCDPHGTQLCDKTNGRCTCKNNVEGNDCGSCKAEYYGRNRTEGCIPCDCDIHGVVSGSQAKNCHEFTGQCTCKNNVQGRQCDECKDGFHGLSVDLTTGCLPCGCSNIGSVNNTCNKDSSGQCHCHSGVNINQHRLCTGRKCTKCEPRADGALSPSFGPLAGGTRVTLTGVFFGNNASQTEFRIGNSTYQQVTRINDTSLEFVTSSQTATGSQDVIIQWRNIFPPNVPSRDLRLPNKFEYRLNPTVTGVWSLKAFQSGGCAVSIKGQGLNSVDQPKLIIYRDSRQIGKTSCSAKNQGKSMQCDSPNLSDTGSKLTYGLYFDGETKYQNLSAMNIGDNTITIVTNPTVNKVQGDMEFTPVFNTKFSIRGDNFVAACSKEDFSIDCGKQVTCTVDTLTNSKITVIPKFDFPGPGTKVKLQVTIGSKVYEAQEINFKLFWSTWQFILIAVGGGVLLVGIVIVIVVCKCCCSRRSMKPGRETGPSDTVLSMDPIPEINSNHEMPRKAARPNSYVGVKLDKENWDNFIHRLNESVRKQLDFSHTDMNDIEPGRRCINKGEHIRIIEGKFKAGTTNYLAGRPTIIKTLVNEYSSFESAGLPQWVSLGLQECLKFRDCTDDNFLQIKGVASDENRFYVLYPSYNRIFKDYLNDKAIQNPLRDLMHFCLQVSDGVKYLHDSNIVHKDIAARNCVITEDKIVKVSDASFSWDIFPNEYMYDERREKYLPVRWMALESLKSGFYDKSSDIWTLGVLMWEVMFEGNSLPYPDVADNKQIKDHIDSGYRLGKSQETPDSLHHLMLSCWEAESEKRVTLDDIIDTLSKMIDPDNFGQNGLYINEEDTMELYQNTTFTNQGFQS